MKKRLLFITFIICIHLFSCSKENQEELEVIQPNSYDKELLSKMEEASTVIAQFANNDEVKSELEGMIKMKKNNDDFVYFKDLFKSSSSDNFKGANINETAFERCFDNVLNRDNEKSGEIDNLKDYLVANDLVLYIPYPLEMYPEDKRIPTISFHPLVNDVESKGIKAILENGEINGFNDVIVDDSYALNNYCILIIPADKLCNEIFGDVQKSAILENNTVLSSKPHYEIRIKHARCLKQYDNLFSGGSEIYFGNGEPIIEGGHVKAPPKGFSHLFSRADIRNERFKDVNTLFIGDWTEDKTQIVMFVYEDDGEGTVKVGGTAKITHATALNDTTSSMKTSNGWETSCSFEATYKSNDVVVFNNDYPRDWFFETNQDPSAEWGKMKEGLILRGNKGHLEYTTSIIVRYY